MDADAFFSGNPNLAARFAKTSSLIPRDAVSMAGAFVFGGEAGSEGVGGAFVGDGADRFEVAIGSKGIPNRSARDFKACCSGVKVKVSEEGLAEFAESCGMLL